MISHDVGNSAATSVTPLTVPGSLCRHCRIIV